MVAILVTPEIRSVLASAKAEGRVEKTAHVETIAHTALNNALRSTYKSSNGEEGERRHTLVSLMRDSEVHLTHEDAARIHNPPKRNEEVERRVARLRQRLDDETYDRMVSDVARTEANNVRIEDLRLRKFAPQFSLAFNVIITMATCFTAAYFVFRNTSGSRTVGLIGGVFGMIVAMLVEVILLLTKLYSVDDAVRKDEKKRRA